MGWAFRCQNWVTDHLNIELQPEVLGIGLGSSTRAVDPSCCGISLTTINFLCQYTELKEQKRMQDQAICFSIQIRKKHVFPPVHYSSILTVPSKRHDFPELWVSFFLCWLPYMKTSPRPPSCTLYKCKIKKQMQTPWWLVFLWNSKAFRSNCKSRVFC